MTSEKHATVDLVLLTDLVFSITKISITKTYLAEMFTNSVEK